MQDLYVTLIQSEIVWENISANLALFDTRLDAITEPTNLIVLPEMFSTGFTMSALSLAEGMDGRAVQWLREKSRQKNADIVGSAIIGETGRYFNRLLWARPDGSLYTYDKRHLFSMAGEDKVYSAGSSLLTVSVKGWNIRPFICYDLRFPVWTRNFDQSYDVSIFIANWPEKRSVQWQKLLVARAIENQCYVVGVNRVGTDGNGFDFSGDSAVINPMGVDLVTLRLEPGIHTVRLSGKTLTDYRRDFPAWMDADGAMVNVCCK